MNTAAARRDPLAGYRAAFDARIVPESAESAQRRAAFEHFLAAGFPSARDEAWKYTNLRRLATREFGLSPAGLAVDARSLAAARATMPGPCLVVVNGTPRPDLSGPLPLPEGIRTTSLPSAIAAGDTASRLLRVPTGAGTERFVALNAALCPDTIVLHVSAGMRAEEPLRLLLITAGEGPLMSHPRIILRAETGSEARVILQHCTMNGGEHFTNVFVDAEVAADATLHVYRLLEGDGSSFHIERVEAAVAQRGRFVMHDAQLGSALARLDVTARLAAPGAEVELTGLFLADGARHLDTQLRVDHLAGDTRSLQDYRGIAAGKGRAVFNSKAIVHPGAQKSDARQVSRNLLLSPGAEIDTKPELEIYADDVQCSHGATTGQLDPVALFYLRSRGLGEAEARNALTRAFVGAVLSRIDDEAFAGRVHDQFDARMVGLLEDDA